MNRSEHIDQLVTALAIAQGQITGALKDSDNPFFKSKYADLAACWDACREPLSKNGLSIVQTPMRGKAVTIEWETTDQKTGEVTSFKVDTEELVIETTLFHSSGQWLSSELPMIPRDATPQGIITAITYGRRAGLCPMVGIAQVDDDGNQASGRANGQAPKEIHSPKGDLGKSVAPSVARAEAVKMRTILSLDVEHRIKALKALDLHEALAKDDDLYVAASTELSAEERKNWKAYVAEARQLEKEDRAVSNVGRRF